MDREARYQRDTISIYLTAISVIGDYLSLIEWQLLAVALYLSADCLTIVEKIIPELL